MHTVVYSRLDPVTSKRPCLVPRNNAGHVTSSRRQSTRKQVFQRVARSGGDIGGLMRGSTYRNRNPLLMLRCQSETTTMTSHIFLLPFLCFSAPRYSFYCDIAPVYNEVEPRKTIYVNHALAAIRSE
jgi:hypothetical protein